MVQGCFNTGAMIMQMCSLSASCDKFRPSLEVSRIMNISAHSVNLLSCEDVFNTSHINLITITCFMSKFPLAHTNQNRLSTCMNMLLFLLCCITVVQA